MIDVLDHIIMVYVSILQKEGEHTLHFGVPICALARTTDSVPFVMEKMLVHVEMNGLYTEGIYRKSGSACRAKELHHILEKGNSVPHYQKLEAAFLK